MNRRARIWTATLGALTIVSALLAIGVGPASVSPAATIDVLLCKLSGNCAGVPQRDMVIVWDIRAPRVVLAGLVGIGLSISGTVIQSVVRNILADPYLLGIASGASTGAATVMVFGAVGIFGLTLGAFAGALISICAVFLLTTVGGVLTAERVVFAGIAVGLFMSALTNLVVFFYGSQASAHAVMFWMLGSLALASWNQLPIPAVITLFTIAMCVSQGPRLDAISLSDDTARALGFNPQTLRYVTITVIAGCVASLVAISGAIGFVGLVVPHIARHLVGATSRSVVPTAGALGALLLIWADAVGRVVFAPRELPIGVITALAGTPLLMLLIRKQYKFS
ncbi:iron ABC transporter permease [uncultured Mobiluncus sp.]|uniref:FecCD family ABC transporter permease n=1 Tax=uncultured Mobiluncus sp. TaxID=293425 RepID=UPI00262B61DA|nr:iron ABC transporter permease [uncultured Mobiluncus sp.]